MSFGGLELHDHTDIFPLMYTKVVMRQVQQSLTYFIGPWDEFMVHDVILVYD